MLSAVGSLLVESCMKPIVVWDGCKVFKWHCPCIDGTCAAAIMMVLTSAR